MDSRRLARSKSVFEGFLNAKSLAITIGDVGNFGGGTSGVDDSLVLSLDNSDEDLVS